MYAILFLRIPSELFYVLYSDQKHIFYGCFYSPTRATENKNLNKYFSFANKSRIVETYVKKNKWKRNIFKCKASKHDAVRSKPQNTQNECTV